MTTKGEKLYEGKAKKIYATENADIVWVEYKDAATAFNGVKKGTITDKGVCNNKISAMLFPLLEQAGVPTHFVELLNDREMLVKKVSIVPVEVVVRNIAAGSLAKRLGLAEGTPLAKTVLEYYYKDDELGDPLINEYHIATLNMATPAQMSQIAQMAFKVNDVLHKFMLECDLELVDFKLEFGLFHDEVILADEISPDTCRFWDVHTHEKLDKDRFRRDLGKVEDAYQEVLHRITDKLNQA